MVGHAIHRNRKPQESRMRKKQTKALWSSQLIEMLPPGAKPGLEIMK